MLIRRLMPFRSRAASVLAGLTLLGALPGCTILPTVCTDELGIEMVPRQRTLAVGESFTPRVTAVSCGGRDRERMSVTWTAADSSVVRIDNASGRITGAAPGQTRVSGAELLGMAWVDVLVTGSR